MFYIAAPIDLDYWSLLHYLEKSSSFGKYINKKLPAVLAVCGWIDNEVRWTVVYCHHAHHYESRFIGRVTREVSFVCIYINFPRFLKRSSNFSLLRSLQNEFIEPSYSRVDRSCKTMPSFGATLLGLDRIYMHFSTIKSHSYNIRIQKGIVQST